MTFHGSFWVLTGATAPVVALAAVITRPMLDNILFEAIENLRQLRDASRRVATKIRLLGHIQAINVTLQAVVLAVSLVSIAVHGDAVPWWLASPVPVAGLLFVAYVYSHIGFLGRAVYAREIFRADVPERLAD